MKKLKLPTSSELGMDLKKILINNNPKNFNEWKNIASKDFSKVLSSYLHRNKMFTKEIYFKMYQIIFYWGFINYQHEKSLIDYLIKYKNFKVVEITKKSLDRFHHIDVIGETFEGKKYCFQVKNQQSNLSFKEREKIKDFATKNNLIPALAYKKNKAWKFKKIE